MPLYPKAVLKTAISLLDQEHKRFTLTIRIWRVKLTWEEFDAPPGDYWEFCNGQA